MLRGRSSSGLGEAAAAVLTQRPAGAARGVREPRRTEQAFIPLWPLPRLCSCAGDRL